MMQLFTINRYDNEEKSQDDANEEKRLEKLLRKVDKRKRKLENQKKEEIIPEQQEVFVESKKVRKEIDSPQQSLEVNIENEEQDQVDSNESELTKDAKKFQVLGSDVFEKKAEAKMVLPLWLRQPTIIVNEIAADSSELNDYVNIISPVLIQNLKTRNMTKLFPVQKQVIPWILEAHSKPPPFRPRDICVSAPTGSGKTLAFAIPIVQLLLNRVECKPRALIVLPATDLASQIFKVFKMLCRNTQLKVGLLSTKMLFEVEQKYIVEKFQDKYYSKLDIIITTPGRLVEHLHATKGFNLKEIRYLVVDEADRIMEQSHHNWLYHLDEHLKTTSESFMTGRSVPLCVDQLINHAIKQPHKMLFSATLTQDPEKLQSLRLFQPKLFTSIVQSAEELVDKIISSAATGKEEVKTQDEFAGKYTTPKELTEYCVVTEQRFKPLTLFTLCKKNKWERFLCFTNSNEAAKRLKIVLECLYKKSNIAELSAALKPNVRQQILNDFAGGRYIGIVCSDALARGIDIDKVNLVISYDAPQHIKTYIHRVGRTARAGQPGTALTILTESEVSKFNKMLSVARKDPLREMQVNAALEEKYAKMYSTALLTLKETVEGREAIKAVRKKNNINRKDNDKRGVMARLQEEIEQQINTIGSKQNVISPENLN